MADKPNAEEVSLSDLADLLTKARQLHEQARNLCLISLELQRDNKRLLQALEVLPSQEQQNNPNTAYTR
jgi:hypothetical protein